VLRLVGTAGGAPLDLPDVRRGAQETRMTKLSLFQALCSLADALQAECVRVDFSPHTIALEAIVDSVDRLIDTVLDEGVDEGGPPRRPGEGRWVLPRKPEDDAHA
jgi:hypothetical protein